MMSKWIQLIVTVVLIVVLLIFTACDLKEDHDKLEKVEQKTIKTAYIKMPDDSVLKIDLAGWSSYTGYIILIANDGTRYRVAYENFLMVEENP